MPVNPPLDSQPIVRGSQEQMTREFQIWTQKVTERVQDGWRDMLGTIVTRGVGSNEPTWSQLGAGPLYGYKFAIGDEFWMSYHVPHDIIPDTDIHFHVHWMPDGTNVNTVKWEWDFAYARGFNQEAFPISSETTVTAEEAGPGIQWQHMITETDAVTIADLSEPDGLIYAHVSRITNGGTDNTDGIFGLNADIHYQSNGAQTPYRTPNFYTR